MRLYALFLFLHVLGTVVWVGGMVVMHFAVRPAAVALLAPPQRLPLMAAALQRFFALVTVSALVVLISGLAMLIGIGMARPARSIRWWKVCVLRIPRSTRCSRWAC